MFDWTARLLDENRRVRNHEQGTKSSVHSLPRRDALFHAPELSRLRNACWGCAELSSIARLHSIAGGSCSQILFRGPNWDACDGAIARADSLMVVIPNESEGPRTGHCGSHKNTVGDLGSDWEVLRFARDDFLVARWTLKKVYR